MNRNLILSCQAKFVETSIEKKFTSYPLPLNLPQLNNRKEKGKKVEGGKKRKQLDLKTSIDLCRWCDSKIHRASVNYRFQSREIVSISNDICRFKFRSDGGRSLNLNL